MENDVWIGQTWDGPALSLKKEGKPVSYRQRRKVRLLVDEPSPSQGWRNTDQIYEFLNYLHTPEASAAVAEGSGYNPIIIGADALLSDAAKKNFQEAYPGEALKTFGTALLSRHGSANSVVSMPDKFKSA